MQLFDSLLKLSFLCNQTLLHSLCLHRVDQMLYLFSLQFDLVFHRLYSAGRTISEQSFPQNDFCDTDWLSLKMISLNIQGNEGNPVSHTQLRQNHESVIPLLSPIPRRHTLTPSKFISHPILVHFDRSGLTNVCIYELTISLPANYPIHQSFHRFLLDSCSTTHLSLVLGL